MDHSDEELPIQKHQEPKDIARIYEQFSQAGSLESIANEDADAEYRLWLISRPTGLELKALSEQRTRTFERAVRKDKIMATAGYVLGAGVEVLFVTNSEIGWSARIGIGIFAAWTLFVRPAENIRRSIPQTKNDANTQRQLHNHYFGVE